MKKIFTLNNPKIELARQIEAAKGNISKYLKRERKKRLPPGVDYWDFDCKFGPTAEEAKDIHLSEMFECIENAAKEELKSFYAEILAKEGRRRKRPGPPA